MKKSSVSWKKQLTLNIQLLTLLFVQSNPRVSCCCCVFNAHSLVNKTFELQQLLYCSKYDIFCSLGLLKHGYIRSGVNSALLDPSSAYTIRYDILFALKNWQASCQFNLAHELKENYQILRKDRPDKCHGGGVAVIVKRSLLCCCCNFGQLRVRMPRTTVFWPHLW